MGSVPIFYCQKFFEVLACFSDRLFICLYTARAVYRQMKTLSDKHAKTSKNFWIDK